MIGFRKNISVLALVAILGFSVVSCSNSTEPNKQTLPQVETPNLTARLPNQTDARVSGMVSMMQFQISMGQSIMDSVSNRLDNTQGDQSFSDGQIEVTYSAMAETRDGVDGVSRTVTFDGTTQIDDTTLTFSNDQIFSSWISDDGNHGEYSFNFDAYALVSSVDTGQTPSSSMYTVSWDIDQADNVTVTSSISDQGEVTDYSLMMDPNGSGKFSENGSIMYQWDSSGNVISG